MIPSHGPLVVFYCWPDGHYPFLPVPSPIRFVQLAKQECGVESGGRASGCPAMGNALHCAPCRLWGGYGVVLGGPLDGSNPLSFLVHHPWVCIMSHSGHSHEGSGPGRVGTSPQILAGTHISEIPS